MDKAASINNTFVPSRSDLREATKRANLIAWALVKRLYLPAEEQLDLRQELLLDLIERFHRFDPARGSFWSFVSMVFRHRAGELARRSYLERLIHRPAPAVQDQYEDKPVDGGAGDDRGNIDFLIDFERSLELLDTDNLQTLESLLESHPAEASRENGVPRSSLYLKRKDLQLRLRMVGIAPANKPMPTSIDLAA